MTLQDCVAKHGSPELSDALRRLSAEAELGRAWRKQLEDGLVALGLSLDLGDRRSRRSARRPPRWMTASCRRGRPRWTSAPRSATAAGRSW